MHCRSWIPVCIAAGLISCSALLHAQSPPDNSAGETTAHQHDSMAGMDHMQHGDQSMAAPPLVPTILEHQNSGTSIEPDSSDAHMIMAEKGSWHLMFHGVAFMNFAQQSGPRGYDKVFSTNWFMPMAQRSLGPGQLTFRTMLSLEPATVTNRFYPELFQQGETAFGRPI